MFWRTGLFSLFVCVALLDPSIAGAFSSKSKESPEDLNQKEIYGANYVDGWAYDENDASYNEYYNRGPASRVKNSNVKIDSVQIQQEERTPSVSGRRPPSYSNEYSVWQNALEENAQDTDVQLYNQKRNYGENHEYEGVSRPEYNQEYEGGNRPEYNRYGQQEVEAKPMAQAYVDNRTPAQVNNRAPARVDNYDEYQAFYRRGNREIASAKPKDDFGPGSVINDIAPDKALAKLKAGNQRFIQGQQRANKEGLSKQDRIRLLAGESPHTVVIATSDSRVSPELLFDQRLGEVFVIRVLGPALDKSVIASIEYAVKTLGVQLVVVLGSENSAGVKSALMNPIGASLGSPYVGHLLRDIHPRISQFYRRPASSGYSREAAANARGIVKDLIRKSTILRSRVGSGMLQVHSAMYYLDSGMVDFH